MGLLQNLKQIIKRYDAESLPTASISGLEIFSAGKWNGDEYTVGDLDQMVSAFSKVGFEPPIKAGHQDGQENEKAAEKVFGAPALGYASRIYRAGSKLLADFSSVPKRFADLVKVGAYKRVSSEIYWNYKDESTGTTYPRVLKAVAFLGADIPALTNLKAIESLYAHSGVICAYDAKKNEYRAYVEESEMSYPDPGHRGLAHPKGGTGGSRPRHGRGGHVSSGNRHIPAGHLNRAAKLATTHGAGLKVHHSGSTGHLINIHGSPKAVTGVMHGLGLHSQSGGFRVYDDTGGMTEMSADGTTSACKYCKGTGKMSDGQKACSYCNGTGKTVAKMDDDPNNFAAAAGGSGDSSGVTVVEPAEDPEEEATETPAQEAGEETGQEGVNKHGDATGNDLHTPGPVMAIIPTKHHALNQATGACPNCNGFGKTMTMDGQQNHCPFCNGVGSLNNTSTPNSNPAGGQGLPGQRGAMPQGGSQNQNSQNPPQQNYPSGRFPQQQGADKTAETQVLQRGNQWCIVTQDGKTIGCYPDQETAQQTWEQMGQDASGDGGDVAEGADNSPSSTNAGNPQGGNKKLPPWLQNKGKAGGGGQNFAHYPWDQCIKDQRAKGDSMESAQKICGSIKAKSQGHESAQAFKWFTRDEMQSVCPSCAERMEFNNIKAIRLESYDNGQTFVLPGSPKQEEIPMDVKEFEAKLAEERAAIKKDYDAELAARDARIAKFEEERQDEKTDMWIKELIMKQKLLPSEQPRLASLMKAIRGMPKIVVYSMDEGKTKIEQTPEEAVKSWVEMRTPHKLFTIQTTEDEVEVQQGAFQHYSNVSDEVVQKTKAYMAKNNEKDYKTATKAVLAADPDLDRRYEEISLPRGRQAS